jgi:phage gp36-like protein
MYLSVALVKTQFPQLLESVTAGKIAEGRVTTWLTSASSLIDSYLGVRFDLPFATVPPMVTTLAYNFFEYFWQKDIHTPTGTGDEVPWIYKRYLQDLKLLENLRDGVTKLLDSASLPIAPSLAKLDTIRSNHQEVDQIFRQNEEPWNQTVDPNYDAEPTF